MVQVVENRTDIEVVIEACSPHPSSVPGLGVVRLDASAPVTVAT